MSEGGFILATLAFFACLFGFIYYISKFLMGGRYAGKMKELCSNPDYSYKYGGAPTLAISLKERQIVLADSTTFSTVIPVKFDDIASWRSSVVTKGAQTIGGEITFTVRNMPKASYTALLHEPDYSECMARLELLKEDKVL